MTAELKQQLNEEISHLEKECEHAWNEVTKADAVMAPFKEASKQATAKWARLNDKVQALKGLV